MPNEKQIYIKKILEGYIRIAVTVGLDKLKEAFGRISAMKIFKE